jgi:hypothetical protein
MNTVIPVRSSTTEVAPDTTEPVAWSPTPLNHTDATNIRGPISAEEEVERGGSTTIATSIPSVDADALVTPSDVYSNILVHTVESPAPQLRAGFEGLRTILNLIDKAACIFPPLKSATSGLLGVIDVIEVRAITLTYTSVF